MKRANKLRRCLVGALIGGVIGGLCALETIDAQPAPSEQALWLLGVIIIGSFFGLLFGALNRRTTRRAAVIGVVAGAVVTLCLSGFACIGVLPGAVVGAIAGSFVDVRKAAKGKM